MIRFVQEFQKNDRFVKGYDTSFIVLVPKVESPDKIKEYKPISLIRIRHKIIEKLLVNQLHKTIDKIIGEQHMDFISGRQLMDKVVISNDVVNKAKKKKQSVLFIVDLGRHMIKLVGI